MVSASSASRSPEAATPAAAGTQPMPQPAVDVTVITSHDDFLLELGQTLGGQAAVRPVDSLEAALEAMASGKRGQVLVIDARELPDVRAMVDTAHAARPRAVLLVFAAATKERQLAAKLKGSKVFAVLPTPVDSPKTQAVLDGAIEAAVANKAAAPPPVPARSDLSIASFRPQLTAALADGGDTKRPRRMLPLLVAVAVAVALAAGGAFWWLRQGAGAPSKPALAAPPASQAAATQSGAPTPSVAAPAADTSILQGKVDELLEKARLAMHERRFTEPAGDNALLYYRSAVAADASNGEARDGLQRVAGVLGSRFDEALSAARFEEAALTLANFKLASPADARVGAFEQRFYSTVIAKALADGNADRATAYLRQAQQSANLSAEQIAKWRTEIARRQEDAKVTRLSGLIEDRIRDGRLTETDDSAKSYMQELQSAVPASAATDRVARELTGAYLRKAREAALAKNSAEEERWLGEARANGAKPTDILAFQKDLTGAKQKAAQAEGERLAQLARQRIQDGRLTDPEQDSAAYYLTQIQSSDPTSASLADASRQLAQALLERARATVQAGKAADADLAQARRWGADPKDLAAVQQLAGPKASGAAVDPATLAASLKRVRNTPPEYPVSALQKRQAGSVTLAFTVDTHGSTRDIHVIEATPPGVFDQAAIDAVKHWRYAPMLLEGSAVEVPVTTRVRFELPKQ
ncbi:MAG TPA: TonB family protein [Steroidobacteraceae bacterium]